jgi:xanthine dehydrogenase/oxidase
LHFSNSKLIFFRYNSFCACASQVELDVLTGEFTVLSSNIVFDCGYSLNPLIDLGQIHGGFTMGLGLLTSENITYDLENGRCTSASTWEYKPPQSLDIPVKFDVEMLPSHGNPVGVLSSKATGEPPLACASAPFLALHAAITAARSDAGLLGWFSLPAPATVDTILQLCGTTPDQLTIS